MNNIERDHMIKVVYGIHGALIKQMLPFLVLLISGIRDFGIIKSLLIVIAIVIIIGLFQFIAWRKNFFYINGDSIFIQKGVFNVKKTQLLFSRVNTVDIHQGIIDRIIGTAQLKVDTGAAKEPGSEMKFVLTAERATEVKEIILSKHEECEEKAEEGLYKLTMKELLLYCLLSNSFFQGIWMIFILFQFLDEIISEIFGIDTARYLDGVENTIVNENVMGIIGLVLTLITLSFFVSVVINFSRFYGYKVFVNGDKLNITYGLINKKNYSFDRNKIKGVHFVQTIMMQLTGFVMLELESVGYGDEEGEKAILYPICRESFKDKLIKELLPGYDFNGELIKAQKNAYINFYSAKIVFCIILNLITIIIGVNPIIIVGLVMTVIILGVAHLEYRNNGLGVTDKLLCASYGAFNKKRTVVKNRDVQAFSTRYTYFQKRKEIRTYTVNLYGGILGKSFTVKNLRDNLGEQIQNKL